ncbi:MAG TPA: DUF4157 domain-containing protein [Kofleriaceae bacterium]|nr:DUF4157 domain-containing protein [Kofleriaceae bacterium]
MSRDRDRDRGSAGAPASPLVPRKVGARTLTQRLASGVATPMPVATASEAEISPPVDAGHDDPFGFHLPQPVQAKADAAVDPAAVRDHAARGVAGAGRALPHQTRIQAAFGGHDVSDVRAHVGGAASEAATAIGAEAYANGRHVAFAREPDLHTAAHEAAHVVQQRAGVQVYGGVGQVGDRYERHADQVADGVVAGESVEVLLGTIATSGAAATMAVQRSPGSAPAGAQDSADVVGALTGPRSATDAYAARHWEALREAVRAALLDADLAWEAPLHWDHTAPVERVEVGLALLWPAVFVRQAWDPTLADEVDEAIDLGLSIGSARQAQVGADADRLARYYPAVGNAVGNTIVRRVKRSMRTVGSDYLAAYEAGGGGAVERSRLPVTGVSDRAAVALLAFVQVTGPVHRPGPQPAHRATHPRSTGANEGAAATAAVERVNEELMSLAGLVGEANLGALAPAYAFVADGPGASPETWQQTVIGQAERLELIRGEVLALVALTHREVPLALKADALAAYARAAGGAHGPDAARLLRLARAEVDDLDRRAAMAATLAAAHAMEPRDPSKLDIRDLDAIEARADRATRGQDTAANGGTPAQASAVGTLTTNAGGSADPSPTPRDDARASRIAAFRQGALRLGDTLAEAREALASARELVGGMFTAMVARDVEALGGEIARIEGLLHDLVDDVMARTGSGNALVEDTVIAEAEARFRDFIKASRVMDLGRQVHAMLARVEQAARILATLGLALVILGTTVAGGLAGSVVGGAVRGALTAAGGEAGAGAVVAGATANVLTQSLVVGGVQTALTGDSFADAMGENLLAAGFTFGALSGARWVRVLAGAKAAWAAGGVSRFLGPGALDLAIGMGANLAAHSLLHPDEPASDDQLIEWTTAAASMVIGRWIGSRLDGLHQRLDDFGARQGQRARWAVELGKLHAELELLQTEVVARTFKPEEYDALIDGRIAPLVERIVLLEQQELGHGAVPGGSAVTAVELPAFGPADLDTSVESVNPADSVTDSQRPAEPEPGTSTKPTEPGAGTDPKPSDPGSRKSAEGERGSTAPERRPRKLTAEEQNRLFGDLLPKREVGKDPEFLKRLHEAPDNIRSPTGGSDGESAAGAAVRWPCTAGVAVRRRGRSRRCKRGEPRRDGACRAGRAAESRRRRARPMGEVS